MSVSLQERRERVESRLDALLLGLDETVRQVYESLLERGADYRELSPEKFVARLEGFHDYIITREETGVEHPSFADYLEAKKKFGDEMLSFGSGKRRDAEAVVSPAVEESEVEDDASLIADEDNVSSVEDEKVTSLLADLDDLQASLPEEAEEIAVVETEEPVIDDEDEVEAEEVTPAETEEAVIDDENEVEGEEVAPVEEPVAEEVEGPATEEPAVEEVKEAKRPVFSDDDEEEEVIIIADAEAAAAIAPVASETKANDVVAAAKEEVKKSVAGRIDERVIIEQDFSTKFGGYNIDEVDEYLDELANFFKVSHSASEYRSQVEDIKNKTFTKKGLKKGFAIDEVDDFLDTVSLELENRSVEVK